MNWTEKYRPQKIDEIIGQHKFVEDARTWIEKGDMPNLLVYGMPGLGKTTVAHVIANHFLGENKPTSFLEINASQDRKLDVIRQTVTKFTTHKSMDNCDFKIILLDELDGMTKDAQRALKRTMERATNVRFIITCNDPYGVDLPIRSRCANYFFQPINNDLQSLALRDIITKENGEFSDDEINILLEICEGDMRRAINELQACIYSGKGPQSIHQEHMLPYNNCVQMLAEGKGGWALDFLLKLVYSGHTVKEICGKLLQSVLDNDEISSAKRFKLVAVIGESEWRGRSVTPKVLVSWMVAQFVKE
tara:strand:+ start:6987 stop:7901 length:915 start_codon:yes stop_codon:yes gene_type:complete